MQLAPAPRNNAGEASGLRGVLQLLHRTNLHLDRRRLGLERRGLAGEGIDALARGLRRNAGDGDLQQPGQHEGAGALPAD